MPAKSSSQAKRSHVVKIVVAAIWLSSEPRLAWAAAATATIRSIRDRHRARIPFAAVITLIPVAVFAIQVSLMVLKALATFSTLMALTWVATLVSIVWVGSVPLLRPRPRQAIVSLGWPWATIGARDVLNGMLTERMRFAR
jgi:hypothetical protein